MVPMMTSPECPDSEHPVPEPSEPSSSELLVESSLQHEETLSVELREVRRQLSINLNAESIRKWGESLQSSEHTYKGDENSRCWY